MQDDMLRGIKAIADFRNEPMRRTYYLAERGLIPVAKMGAIYEARKSRLIEHQRQLEDANIKRGLPEPEAAQ